MEKKIMDINLNHLSKKQKAKLVNDVLNDYEAVLMNLNLLQGVNVDISQHLNQWKQSLKKY